MIAFADKSWDESSVQLLYIAKRWNTMASSLSMFRVMQLIVAATALALSTAAMAEKPVRLEISEVAPVRFEKHGDVFFADFGKDAYGNLRIEFSSEPPAGVVQVRLGEKLAADGTIDRNPPGSVNYRELSLSTQPGQRRYQLEISSKKFHLGAASVKMPDYIGEVTPFRYAEIEGATLPVDTSGVRQLFVHAPFKDDAARFESSDETLNAVWGLCKNTMKATTAFGVYIDGERERISYEADAYINLLSHYACDVDPRVAHATIDRLLAHPTWPTEWSLHMPMIAAADYRATGDSTFAAANYEQLKKKLLRNKARGDGLLRATAVVDWPEGERDGYDDGKKTRGDRRQVGPEINTVANAFYYHAIQEMAVLARALKKKDEAKDLDANAARVYAAFNRVFFDAKRGVYRDGEGSAHASLHANMFALAFGLVPAEHVKSVGDFVQSRGMACSVYGAQYLLEALFAAGRSDAAIQLMSARTERSWWHMIELGSTMTLEAWDAEFKKNLTWNHAWGSAPANILSRFVLGVRPIKPGYSEMLIAPQPGNLKWVRGQVPTPHGPVTVNATNADVFKVEVTIPRGSKARIQLPRRAGGQIVVDGKRVSATGEGVMLSVGLIKSGTHVIESR